MDDLNRGQAVSVPVPDCLTEVPWFEFLSPPVCGAVYREVSAVVSKCGSVFRLMTIVRDHKSIGWTKRHNMTSLSYERETVAVHNFYLVANDNRSKGSSQRNGNLSLSH